MRIEAKLRELGLVPAPPIQPPPGVRFPFTPVRVVGDRAYISGHGPRNSDGSYTGPFGKVGAEVTAEQGYQAARLAALSMLGSLGRELGDLDRITAWVRVFGMVNSAPGFSSLTAVINGFSDLILELFGEAGAHARSAVGVAVLPSNLPVEVEAEVQIAP
jgi:Putative translation initiation inhibitor, yjgF family